MNSSDFLLAITEHDFILIPEIIQNPDEIRRSDDLFEGKPVIKFIKTLNGKTTAAAYVSDRHLDLAVQTMHSGKNKGNLAVVAGEQAPADTPEVNAGTVSNNSIHDSVNTGITYHKKIHGVIILTACNKTLKNLYFWYFLQ